MDIKFIKKLLQFMEEHNLSEIEIEEENQKIKLKKATLSSMPLINNLPINSNIQLPNTLNNNPQPTNQNTEKKEISSEESYIEITSPMVGTFYRAPSPGAKPFVEVGDKINPGDVVCIIEAMKLMNEIKAEVSGIVEKILVENAEPVEFGQKLFLVKPL